VSTTSLSNFAAYEQFVKHFTISNSIQLAYKNSLPLVFNFSKDLCFSGNPLVNPHLVDVLFERIHQPFILCTLLGNYGLTSIASELLSVPASLCNTHEMSSFHIQLSTSASYYSAVCTAEDNDSKNAAILTRDITFLPLIQLVDWDLNTPTVYSHVNVRRKTPPLRSNAPTQRSKYVCCLTLIGGACYSTSIRSTPLSQIEKLQVGVHSLKL
jgi:hypothetical protein